VTEALLQSFLMYVVVPLLAVPRDQRAVLLVMVIGLVLHQATAVWDVRYANATRRVSPVEARFALERKHIPLPGWYLATVMLGVAVFGALPYGEELLRTARGTEFTRARTTGSGS
jgi:hypothetical protein